METKLGGTPPRVQGYSWVTKNKHAGSGGIAILTRNDIANKVKEVTSLEQNDMEILWVELTTNNKPIFIGVYYGPQEGTPTEELELQYETIRTHISTLKRKGKVILTGDFNAKIKVNSGTTKQ